MKQRIKKQNNRKKADFGLGAALFTLATTLIGQGINYLTQEDLADRQRRRQLLMNNETNALQAAANQTQALNYNQQNELESLKTGHINSLNNQSSQFKNGGTKYILRRKYKNYTDPYAKDWYNSIFSISDFEKGRIEDARFRGGNNLAEKERLALKQGALNAADYIESMYRYHQRKYLAERNNRESNPNFVGPPSPKGYVPNTIKEGMQFKNYDARLYGPYNDNYPDLPEDYNKYKCGGKKRMKKNGGTITSNLNKLNIYI